jgi:uncharacterized phiE125 gp8 family phage protein
MALSLITGPTVEPLTWPIVQKQIRQDGNDDDAEFVTNALIPAARDRGELSTGRAFIGPQTWQLVLDTFPSEDYIELPRPPLIGIDFVKYVDTAGVLQTWDPAKYLVEAPAGPRCQRGRVALPFAGIWPITLQQRGAVTIQFTCGYAGTAGDPAAGVPPLLVMAMLTDAGALYENREAIMVDTRAAAIEVPGLARDIYRSYRSRATQRSIERYCE